VSTTLTPFSYGSLVPYISQVISHRCMNLLAPITAHAVVHSKKVLSNDTGFAASESLMRLRISTANFAFEFGESPHPLRNVFKHLFKRKCETTICICALGSLKRTRHTTNGQAWANSTAPARSRWQIRASLRERHSGTSS
jgi:hypothetical protein